MSILDRFRRRNSTQDALSVVLTRLDTFQGDLTNLTNFNSTLQQQVLLRNQFQSFGGFLRGDINNQINYIRQGYNISSAVYSIVSDIAQKASAIPLKVYEVKNDNALKNYIGSKGQGYAPENMKLMRDLRIKALQEVPEDNPLQYLVDHPNTQDDPSYFYQMTTGFRLLTGNWYWYTPVLDAGNDKGKVGQLHIMPAPYVLIAVTQYFPAMAIGYELIINGVVLLNTIEVCHSKYPNYDWTFDGQQLYGMSPLKAAARTLKRANDSETAGLSQLENNGPAMILANKSIQPNEFATEQLAKSKQQNQNEYGGPANRGKVKYMAGDITGIPLGISPVELDLIAGEQWNFAMLCNVFKVSDVLFNNHSASTESNVKEMRKDSYTRSIIPERQAHADAFNRKIVPGYNTKGKRYFVDLDLSGIPELQPDMGTMSTWLGTSWWVTPNEKREMQDFGKSPDPNMDKVWMPQGLMTMDDISIQVDEANDPTLDDNAEPAGVGEPAPKKTPPKSAGFAEPIPEQ